MLKNINGTTFNLDFCKGYKPERLRRIYNSESKETLDLLIAECFPIEEKEAQKPKASKK